MAMVLFIRSSWINFRDIKRKKKGMIMCKSWPLWETHPQGHALYLTFFLICGTQEMCGSQGWSRARPNSFVIAF